MTPTTHIPAAPVVPSAGALRPLGLDEVHISGGFWGGRQQVNGTATLSHIEHWLEREGWLGNFDLAAAGTLPAGRRGREFSDSEVYKYLEALAWEIGRRGADDGLEARFRAIVQRVAAAQQPDGYLNTEFGRPGQQPRWSDLEWGHELYCLGHLFQAAVARERTAPASDDGLLGIACRSADLICELFSADGIQAVCGHAEVEVGLAELARVTGRKDYAAQAALFVERRGRGTLRDIEWGRAYFQDDIPVRDAEVLRGHAVRANYLAAGAVDIAVDGADADLLAALKLQWDTTVARRTYLTGGQGSHHQDEAFGEDWELPADRAYSETCASIASVMFSWRLLLSENEPRYADLIERTLFNVVATSPSADGTAFFYANTLHQRRPGEPSPPDVVSPRASSSVRAPWFEVSCCPPNVARTLASLGAYVATADDDGVQVHQYAPATLRTVLPGGRAVALAVETDYPNDGVIAVRMLEGSADPFTLTLRVPEWAASARLVVRSGGEVVEESQPGAGFVAVRRAFEAEDVVELTLPMEPRYTEPDPRIDAVRDSLAVERGPEVYCLESTDLGELSDVLGEMRIDAAAPPQVRDGRVVVSLRRTLAPRQAWPYASPRPEVDEVETHEVALMQYHSWAERGPSTMRVWLPIHR